MAKSRILFWTVFISVFVTHGVARAEAHSKLKIGILLSLSGGLEQWCDYIRQGVELAASEHSRDEVEIIIEDDLSLDRKASITAARKLIDRDSVQALFAWSLSNAPALSPIAQRAHVPLLVGASDKRIARAGDYVFGSIVNYQLMPRDVARFFKARGVRRAALVLATDDWSASYEVPFREEATRLGIDIVYSESITATETETRSIISALKQRKVEGVLAPLYGNALLSFIRRHREMKAQSLIQVGDGMFEGDIKTLGEAAEGVTAMQIWLESREFSEKVQKRFGAARDPLQLGVVAIGYDSIIHLIKAARDLRERGVQVSGENLNQTLKTFKSIGYLGEYMLGAPPAKAGEQPTVVEAGRYKLAEPIKDSR